MPLFRLSSIFLRHIGFFMVASPICPFSRPLAGKGTHRPPRMLTFSDIPESLRSVVTVLTSQQNLICRGKAPSNGFPLRFTPRVSSKTTLGSSATLARSAERLLLQFPVAGTDSKGHIGHCPF